VKRFLMLVGCVFLCFVLFLLPAAAAQADEAEPAALQVSPYEEPQEEDYEDFVAYDKVYQKWSNSLFGRYYQWSRGLYEDRPWFDPAFRALDADDPILTIKDHFVFK